MYLLVVHVPLQTTVMAMGTPVAAAEVGEQMALSIMLVDAEGMLVYGAPRVRFWTRTSTAWGMVVNSVAIVTVIFNFVSGDADHYFSR